MPQERPDHSLRAVEGARGAEKPELELLRHFQVKEADYMKPPLAEQLLEPEGGVAPTATSGVVVTTACTCNSVCVCVPVSTCVCNTVCTCNTVSSTYGVRPSSGSGGGGCYRGGGVGGYWAPCF